MVLGVGHDSARCGRSIRSGQPYSQLEGSWWLMRTGPNLMPGLDGFPARLVVGPVMTAAARTSMVPGNGHHLRTPFALDVVQET
jgi:hypothetical protein